MLLVVFLRPKRGLAISLVLTVVIVTPTSFFMPDSRSAIGTDMSVEAVLRPIEDEDSKSILPPRDVEKIEQSEGSWGAKEVQDTIL